MSDNIGAWRRLYGDIGELLFANKLAPTTANFDLCRRYLTRSDPELNQCIDDAIARHGGLTPAVAADALARHSREVSLDDILAFAREARTQMDEAAVTLGRASEDAATYADALRASASTLETEGSPQAVIEHLIAVTRSMNELAASVQERLRRSGDEIQALRNQLAEASRTANTDPLTGLPNRRALDVRLRTTFDSAKESKAAFSIAICDIDHFKKINDNHGHPIGDEVIKFVAGALSTLGKDNLFVARYGGEEFVVVFDGLTPEKAAARLDPARRAVAAKRLQVTASGQSLGQVSFSAGIAGAAGRRDPSALLKAADKALYRAKNEGRNRLCIAD